MTETDEYFDVRSALWRRGFAQALDYDAYLAASPPAHAQRWVEMAGRIPPLSAAERARLSGFPRLLNVLLVSGVWCGDCARQGPMIRNIVRAAAGALTLRVIDRDVNPALRDEVRLLGARRVPVAVFLTEQFLEAARLGDRMLSTYRRKAATETGAACPVPYGPLSPEDLGTEQSEWVDAVERILLMTMLSPAVRSGRAGR